MDKLLVLPGGGGVVIGKKKDVFWFGAGNPHYSITHGCSNRFAWMHSAETLYFHGGNGGSEYWRGIVSLQIEWKLVCAR